MFQPRRPGMRGARRREREARADLLQQSAPRSRHCHNGHRNHFPVALRLSGSGAGCNPSPSEHSPPYGCVSGVGASSCLASSFSCGTRLQLHEQAPVDCVQWPPSEWPTPDFASIRRGFSELPKDTMLMLDCCCTSEITSADVNHQGQSAQQSAAPETRCPFVLFASVLFAAGL